MQKFIQYPPHFIRLTQKNLPARHSPPTFALSNPLVILSFKKATSQGIDKAATEIELVENILKEISTGCGSQCLIYKNKSKK